MENPWYTTLDSVHTGPKFVDLGSNQINKFKFKVSLKYTNYENEKTKTLKNEKASLFLNGLS